MRFFSLHLHRHLLWLLLLLLLLFLGESFARTRSVAGSSPGRGSSVSQLLSADHQRDGQPASNHLKIT
ncbi:uncharacterized protein Dmoj_GI26025 [Drosophila mojavensis]|uniref:Secreted protein n=1 Tax=Drosophila mojavensis TaxID=7230 RepID=A0A0Q9X009_DROMO|nr:uncharacterized protein Dmoj_GI26025 [Drosophila mojavensis]